MFNNIIKYLIIGNSRSEDTLNARKTLADKIQHMFSLETQIDKIFINTEIVMKLQM